MEAASSASPTSKVSIQCTDPDNLLETFQGPLLTRTPLRNLHWKSPTRPLRSIPSLNISLVRKESAQNGAQSGVRRHQIPGLRATPYVKLYLLRCDDKESYKDSARKEIKQWIKENTLEKESKTSLRKQEHHDAYEWMIVHVVVPGTVAATQPKSSKHISLETTDSTDSVNSKSKWSGKSTSTIFDKLRADFHSSKSHIPRVAQVRITEQGKPQGALSPTEVEEQWQDLADILKVAILKSFDSRVSEYEEDIRERESQRNLPGWNFCTFFILKEGLARGFENVGLLDDALAVYSELETGLDIVVKETHEQDDIETAGALLPYSKDLKTIIRRALDEVPNELRPTANGNAKGLSFGSILESDLDQSPLKLDDDRYRDLILKNQVSSLDLRTYMFTRQMGIMLRQAGLSAESKNDAKSAHIDLTIVADFAEMALSFINLAAREYRSNLYAAWGGRLSGGEQATQKIVIGNLVASWSWSALMHVVARLLPAVSDQTIQLDQPVDTVLGNLVDEPTQQENDKRPVTPRPHSALSARSSPQRGPRTQSLPRSAAASKESLEVPMSRTRPPARPGLDQVCGWIAQMVLLARGVLQQPESAQPWLHALKTAEPEGHGSYRKKLQRLSSYGEPALLNGSAANPADSTENDQLLCLDSAILRTASSSQEAFSNVYRCLCAYACHLFQHAGYRRAADQVLYELAELSYSSGDKPAAADFLGKALDSSLQGVMASLQPSAVAMYAECLECAGRPKQYMQCLLACLRFAAVHDSTARSLSYFNKLVKVAPSVDPITVSLGSFLLVRDTDTAISHLNDRDGFSLSVEVQPLHHVTLSTGLSMKLNLSAVGAHEPEQLQLQGPNELTFGSESTSLCFTSNVNTTGWYVLDHLEIKIGSVSFLHHFQQDVSEGIETHPRKHNVPSVMVYPSSKSVSLDMMPSTSIILSETRSVSLLIQTDSNISRCTIRLRAASAGLRLKIHDSTSSGSLTIERHLDSPILNLNHITAGTGVTVEVPYTLESTFDPSIAVKCEANYVSEGETFSFYKTCFVDVILPVSVNVQDIHRDSYWYSKFLIRPATLVPIVLWGCNIGEDANVSVEAGKNFDEPLIIFPNQPASWTVRLHRHESSVDRRIMLSVRYQCLDELLLNTLSASFTASFEHSPFPQAIALLRSHLVQTIKNGWTQQDLDVAGLTREMEIWPMQDLDWPSVLCSFENCTKDVILGWIETWHSHASPLPIKLQGAPIRVLKLPVDLPPRPPVVETGLEIENALMTIPVGQPLASQLSFELSTQEENSQQSDLEFSYEIHAPSEAWLIGGRKKGSFSANERATTFQIVLFPQRTGSLLLPTVDVRCRRSQRSNTVSPGLDVPIDVNNQTLSKSIQVTPSLKSTTIGVMSDEATQMSSGAMVGSQIREPAPS